MAARRAERLAARPPTFGEMRHPKPPEKKRSRSVSMHASLRASRAERLAEEEKRHADAFAKAQKKRLEKEAKEKAMRERLLKKHAYKKGSG
jgi:hypothetical protein